MDSLHVDYSGIQRLDIVRLRFALPAGGPPSRPAGQTEASAFRSAIGAASYVSNLAALLKEISDIAAVAKRVGVSLVGGTGPMITGPGAITAITIGAGASSSVFAYVGVTVGAGIYGSSTPELGFYSSRGGGIWTDVGIGSELVLTYVLGPPAAFGGLSWGVGVSCDIPGVGVGISCTVLFGASGPPFPLLGWCVGVGAGLSVLPASISFQASNTQLIPI